MIWLLATDMATRLCRWQHNEDVSYSTIAVKYSSTIRSKICLIRFTMEQSFDSLFFCERI